MPSDKKLIKGVVESYNIVAKKLIESISKKEIDHDEFGRLFEGLKEHRTTIKRLFKDNASLEGYKPEISAVLVKIRNDKDIYAFLSSFVNKTIVDGEEICDFYDDDMDAIIELNGEYDLSGTLLRRIEAGALITGRKMPRSVVEIFIKVRECYMFEQYEATIIFCRSLMEEALRKYYLKINPGVSTQTVKNKNLSVLLKETNFPERLSILKAELIQLKNYANDLLHGSVFFNEPPVRTININQGANSFSVTYKDNTVMRKKALAAIRTVATLAEEL